MKEKGKATTGGDRVLRVVAVLVLWIAPLPAAFFVGRSVYWHLIYGWHLDLGILGIAAAVIAGAMIELVGILSAHVALALHRWNGHGNVRKKVSAWERAPFWIAAVCFSVYALVAIALAVVLEALPWLAIYAPALVTAMAADAYVTIGLYDQHRDRLARYNLQWNWIPQPHEIADGQVTPAAPMVVQVMSGMAPSDATLISGPVSGLQLAPGPVRKTLVDVAADFMRLHPDWTDARVMQEVPCSASTVRRAREREEP